MFWKRVAVLVAVAALSSLPLAGQDASAHKYKSDGTRHCTRGYRPCLHPAYDYDCRGGSGDGPRYTDKVRVWGSDPYRLDSNNNGWGCE